MLENANKKNAKGKSIQKMTIMAILIALIVLMSFTPIGFLKIGAIEVSFLAIPVALGAIVLGPTAGAILGTVFGIISFIQCFGISPFGTMLMSINPFFTFILCIIPRTLFGLLSGLIFKALNKIDKTKILSFGIASFSAAFFNTVLFVGGLLLLFGSSQGLIDLQSALSVTAADNGGINIIPFFAAFVGINGVLESVAALILGGAVSKAVYHFNERMK